MGYVGNWQGYNREYEQNKKKILAPKTELTSAERWQLAITGRMPEPELRYETQEEYQARAAQEAAARKAEQQREAERQAVLQRQRQLEQQRIQMLEQQKAEKAALAAKQEQYNLAKIEELKRANEAKQQAAIQAKQEELAQKQAAAEALKQQRAAAYEQQLAELRRTAEARQQQIDRLLALREQQNKPEEPAAMQYEVAPRQLQSYTPGSPFTAQRMKPRYAEILASTKAAPAVPDTNTIAGRTRQLAGGKFTAAAVNRRFKPLSSRALLQQSPRAHVQRPGNIMTTSNTPAQQTRDIQ